MTSQRRVSVPRNIASLDDLDGDVGAFETSQLLDRGAVGTQMDDLVGVSDAVGVVVEAEVSPRSEVDEVAVFRVESWRAIDVEFSRQVADLLPPVELFERQCVGH